MTSSDTEASEPATRSESELARTRSSRRPLLIGLAIALLVAGIGVLSLELGSRQSTDTGPSAAAKVGDAVAPFSLPALSGTGTVGVPQDGGGDGRPAVLVFFASWCGPCQREMPGLAKAVAEGQAGRAKVIGIDGADQPSAAKAFVQKTGITFPVGRDDQYAVTSGHFGLPGLPGTIFVTGDGRISSIHLGPTTPALLRQGVAQMAR